MQGTGQLIPENRPVHVHLVKQQELERSEQSRLKLKEPEKVLLNGLHQKNRNIPRSYEDHSTPIFIDRSDPG